MLSILNYALMVVPKQRLSKFLPQCFRDNLTCLNKILHTLIKSYLVAKIRQIRYLVKHMDTSYPTSDTNIEVTQRRGAWRKQGAHGGMGVTLPQLLQP